MISNIVDKVFKRIMNSKITPSKKIFCISFQRTGTTSVGGFFKQFGYVSRGWPACVKNDWSRLWYDGDYESIFSSKDFKTGQLFEDSPWWHPEFYKVIYKLHNKEVVDFFNTLSPSSLFTCNLDDQQKWSKLGQFVGIEVPDDFEVHLNKSVR